jgi:hypothetical protein
MANNAQLRGTPFQAIASGTSSASAAFSKPTAAVTYYVTDLSGTSTTAGTWAVLCGATGTTTYWAGIANVNTPLGTHIVIPAAGTLTFLMNGATSTFANISGYWL